MTNDNSCIAELVSTLTVCRQALLRALNRMRMDSPMVWELQDCEGALVSIDRALDNVRRYKTERAVESVKDASASRQP